MAERGEHVRVVRLRRVPSRPVVRHRLERRPRRERDVSIREPHGVLERALGFVRGVGQRENHRPLVELRHFFQHGLVERARDRGDPDQRRGFQSLDRLE